MFVKRVGNLHSTNEHDDNDIVIAVVYQSHLTLKITDILFETLLGLYLDSKEVIVVLSQLSSRSVLVVENLLHLSEISKRLC